MVHLKRSLFAVVFLLSPAAMLTLASDFVPIQNFREPADSPFPEFGFDGSLVVRTLKPEGFRSKESNCPLRMALQPSHEAFR